MGGILIIYHLGYETGDQRVYDRHPDLIWRNINDNQKQEGPLATKVSLLRSERPGSLVHVKQFGLYSNDDWKVLLNDLRSYKYKDLISVFK